MLQQERTKVTSQIIDPFTEAKRCWDCYGKGDERLLTIRAIISVTKISLRTSLSEDERDEIAWLMTIGESLADMAIYEPESISSDY